MIRESARMLNGLERIPALSTTHRGPQNT